MIKRFIAVCAVLCLSLAAHGATQPILQPYQTFLNPNAAGSPCAGCSLFSYAAGTTTPLPTYTDSTGLTQNTNPIILDTGGGAKIWLGDNPYKFVLKDTLGSTLWTVDNVSRVATINSLSAYLPLAGGALSGGFSAPTISSVFYPANAAALQADVTMCGSASCTIHVTSTMALSSTYAIPANVSLVFENGAQLQPASTTTLTINGPIQGSPVRIFGGAGTIALGPLTSTAPVQWWGAAGDSDHIGSIGTDNTAAIQACLNSVAPGSECFVPAGDYKITGALSITRSGVSLRGVSSPVTYVPGWSTPHPSRIVTTSPTANIVNVWGANTSSNVVDVFIENITLSRGVTSTPEGTGECNASSAIGISSKFTYANVYQNVSIEDSATGIYFHGAGASAKGYSENDDVIWGSNGVSAGTGVYCGYYEDSKDGTASPSLRLRNLDAQAPQVPPSHPGLTIYGFAAKGAQMSDIHVFHMETYFVDYGVSLVGVGMTGFAQATDIFFENCILDNSLVSGYRITGLSGFGTVNITDGWLHVNGASASPAVDIDGSANVHVGRQVIFAPAITAPVIRAVAGGSEQIIDNEIIGGTAGAITLDNTPANVISSNLVQPVAGVNWGTNIINLINGSSYSVVSNNSLSGTATNGIAIDVATISTGGLETNSIGDPALGTITNILNVSANNFTPVYNGMRVGLGATVVTGTQGADTNLMTAGTVSGTGATLCTDANQGATTTGCYAVVDCGTTTSCANTAQNSPRVIWGVATLSAGAVTITGISPAFTNTISFSCTATDYTATNAVKASIVSSSSISLAGTGTDQVTYICVGN